MTLKLAVVMDPLCDVHFKKDSTLALLFAAQKRGYILYYFEPKDLYIFKGQAFGNARKLHLSHDQDNWFTFAAYERLALADLNIILMRKDPPFDLEYIYTTHILELAEKSGVTIINKPQSLRDFNEKLITSYFPTCCPETLVTSQIPLLEEFLETHEDIICKPLEGMGGASIFRLKLNDTNVPVLLENLTHLGTRYIMAQRFIPEIKQGDKRILLINGKIIPYALARIPREGELRGNLAKGAVARIQELSSNDKIICQTISPFLQVHGLFFVGIDVIGNFLTEINITSPTGIREIERAGEINICEIFFDELHLMLA